MIERKVTTDLLRSMRLNSVMVFPLRNHKTLVTARQIASRWNRIDGVEKGQRVKVSQAIGGDYFVVIKTKDN